MNFEVLREAPDKRTLPHTVSRHGVCVPLGLNARFLTWAAGGSCLRVEVLLEEREWVEEDLETRADLELLELWEWCLASLGLLLRQLLPREEEEEKHTLTDLSKGRTRRRSCYEICPWEGKDVYLPCCWLWKQRHVAWEFVVKPGGKQIHHWFEPRFP